VPAHWVSQNLSAHDHCQPVASSQAAEFIHKRQRTVLSSFGYWGQNVDLSFGPIKQIRIHSVEARHLRKSVTQPINWLDYGNSFSAYWKDNYIGWYHAEPTFKLLDVIKQKH